MNNIILMQVIQGFKDLPYNDSQFMKKEFSATETRQVIRAQLHDKQNADILRGFTVHLAKVSDNVRMRDSLHYPTLSLHIFNLIIILLGKMDF